MTLSQLIAAVERAEGVDRQLMCMAFHAVFPEVSSGALDAIDAWDTKYDRFCAMLDAGAHLDAAVMLVPEGLRWCVDTCGGRPHSFVEDIEDFAEEPLCCKANCATPAFALVAAALRAHEARAAMEGR